MNQSKSKDEGRQGYFIGGFILIGIGGLFLMVNMGWLPYLTDSWPLILIIVGVALLIGGFTKSRKKGDESTP
ncbi:MAG: DUF5668 domain-containing protein [Candidatus Zixiibacteriota bacterium]